ncbi:hypothetical protein AGLY_009165, partial [Aphis glycines]
KLKNREKRSAIEEKTRDQANSQIWLVKRRNRLKASNFGRVCKLQPTTSYTNTEVSNATNYGKDIEPEAIVALENQLKIKVYPCGLIIDENFSYLATSPDGIVDDDFIVEINVHFTFGLPISPNEIFAILSNWILIFYTECLLPEIVNLQYGRRLLVDDIIDPEHILEYIYIYIYIHKANYK